MKKDNDLNTVIWMELMREARRVGLTIDEIELFIEANTERKPEAITVSGQKLQLRSGS